MFALLITRLSAISTSGPLCGLWFDVANGTCLCSLKLSSDQKRCAPTCEQLGETESDQVCVPKLTRKTADANGCKDDTSVAGGNCQCDTNAGWAGSKADSQTCQNCWKIKQVSSTDGWYCQSCAGKYQMQNYPHNAEDEVIKYSDTADYHCVMDTANGYVGTIKDDSTFADNGEPQLCWNLDETLGQVPNIYGTACVSCNQKYGEFRGMKFSNAAKYHCAVDIENGYAGAIASESLFEENLGLTSCWTADDANGAVQDIDRKSCLTCNNKYKVDSGVIYSNLAQFHCKIDSQHGYTGAIKDESTFQVGGNPVLCWDTVDELKGLVPSKDFKQCVSCSFKYDVSGVIYSNLSPYHCAIDTIKGYAGTIKDDSTFIDDGTPQLCWNSDETLGKVPNTDGTLCVTCNEQYNVYKGMKYSNTAKYHCIIDTENGYVGIMHDDSTFQYDHQLQLCWNQDETKGLVQDSSNTVCKTCNDKYDVIIGLVYSNSASYYCAIDEDNGYIGLVGEKQLYIQPQLCWNKDEILGLVQNSDFTSCISCADKYQITQFGSNDGIVYSNTAQYHCDIDITNGYVGNIKDESSFEDAKYPVLCWSDEGQFVQDLNRKMCVKCNEKYNVKAGMKYSNTATYHCIIDTENGYVGKILTESTFETHRELIYVGILEWYQILLEQLVLHVTKSIMLMQVLNIVMMNNIVVLLIMTQVMLDLFKMLQQQIHITIYNYVGILMNQKEKCKIWKKEHVQRVIRIIILQLV
ncbi:Hypothetical_protein [Hexamita inflata]|uniref:Hypothetical_protein n=1 Tax=Hexamita inflata TaxID=28002 RepID=A0AA86U196_9EUKA|nr:Hypothetical protein HINF_LOCUS24001 [Hexamita inflata]